MVITDRELPSRGNESGEAVIVIDRPPLLGPVSDGCVCFSRPHPASSTAAAVAATQGPSAPNIVVFIIIP